MGSKLSNILSLLLFAILFLGLCGAGAFGMFYVASLFPVAFLGGLLLVCLTLFFKRQ
jgi:hypothetical protein